MVDDKNEGISLLDALASLDETSKYTQDIRRLLVEKFLTSVTNADPNIDTWDSEQASNISTMLSQIRQFLNDIDTSANKQVAAKLKKTDLDQQRESDFDVARMLAAIKLSDHSFFEHRKATQDYDTMADRIAKEYNESGGREILEGELSLGGNNLPKDDTGGL